MKTGTAECSALALEPERLGAERRRLGAVDAYARGKRHRHHSHQSRGHYAEQPEAWFEWFPRERGVFS